MLDNIVHGTYELVEKIAEEAPGPNADTGKGFIWVGAALGAFICGSLMLDIIGNPQTRDDLTTWAVSGALGAIIGACSGFLVWGCVLYVSARSKRAHHG